MIAVTIQIIYRSIVADKIGCGFFIYCTVKNVLLTPVEAMYSTRNNILGLLANENGLLLEFEGQHTNLFTPKKAKITKRNDRVKIKDNHSSMYIEIQFIDY